MKIGILTFHSQLNYGGVLQCWALQTALEKMGHEVKIIDRWLDPKNETLRGFVFSGWKSYVLFLRDVLCLNGVFSTLLRSRKTRHFIDKNLEISNFHFWQWREAPKTLGVDMLVVGSDQVWNSFGAKDPSVYLLKDAPCIKAIAYAASLGMREIAEAKRAMYIEGLRRFDKISVREESARRIISGLGFIADKVADPVLLLEKDDWNRISCASIDEKPEERLICYFISARMEMCYDDLFRFACETGSFVEVYLASTGEMRRLTLSRKLRSLFGGRVKMRLCAGPAEFLSALRSSDNVLTDSFHAVMFSLIFGKNVRVLKPTTTVRMEMFERIEELSSMVNDTEVMFAEDVETALASFRRGERLLRLPEKMVQFSARSREWLAGAVSKSV